MQARQFSGKEFPESSRGEGYLTDDLVSSNVNFWPGDMWNQWRKMNDTVRNCLNLEQTQQQLRPIREVEQDELLTFLTLVIGATNQ